MLWTSAKHSQNFLRAFRLTLTLVCVDLQLINILEQRPGDFKKVCLEHQLYTDFYEFLGLNAKRKKMHWMKKISTYWRFHKSKVLKTLVHRPWWNSIFIKYYLVCVYLNQDGLHTNSTDKKAIKHVCYDMGFVTLQKSESVAQNDSVWDVSCQNCKCKWLISKPHTMYLSGLETMLVGENYFSNLPEGA